MSGVIADSAPATVPTPGDGSPRRRLVVVGNGMAGIRAVEEILARDGGARFRITVLGDEPHGNYNRILLSNMLAGSETEDEIVLNPFDWYEVNGIRLRTSTRAVRVDRYARIVDADDGTCEPYDKLIIATGSRPYFPPMRGLFQQDGSLTPGVFGFRTINDCHDMIRHAGEHRTAVVLGGGLLGLEAARGLQTRGLRVHVLHAASTLMNRQLSTTAGAILRRTVVGLGIHVHVDARTEAVLGGHRVTGVALADGTTIPCDMLVVAAGIRPNSELGIVSGLTVERAIVVDDQMRSVDDPDIYAVGECAQHRDQVYGLVAPLWEQAAVLADHVTGRDPRAAYHGSRIVTKLKVAGVDVASMGVMEAEHDDDEFIVTSEPHRGVYRSVVLRGDRLVGATLLGDMSRLAFLMQAFDRGLPLPDERVRLLFDVGAPSAAVAAEELDDDAQICNCNGVSKAAIVACVRAGECSVGRVMATTRAGKGCGSCRPLVTQVVEWAAGSALEKDASATWYVPGIPMEKPELMEAIRSRELRSVSAVLAALAPGGVGDAVTRMGLTSLLRMMWGRGVVDERDSRFINDRVHANIQKDGTFSVVPQILGGVTSPAQLRRIADVAERYQVPMVKVTGGQRIDLLGIRKRDLPGVWAALDMPSGYAYAKSFRTVKTCVGSEFCRFGLGDSTRLGMAIEQRYQGLESPAKMKLAVAGCPRNCSEALVKDLGVVAIEGGRWEVYVGGAAGAHVRKGDLLATVDTPGEVLRLAGRFLQHYRENARWLERTYAFVPRVGLERLRALLVDDSEGIGAALDAAMQSSVDDYRDPWMEGRAPVTPGQFEPELTLVTGRGGTRSPVDPAGV
jgi:nitrite reductase (NADH) large subunit